MRTPILRGRTALGVLVLLVLVLLASGCSVIVGDEVGDLRPDLNAKRDVTVSLRDFGPHVDQLLDVQVVVPGDPAADIAPLVSARVTIDAVPSDCLDMRLRRGAPFVASRVDFYADLNMNGVLDPPSAGDHSWRRDLDESGRLLFIHDVQFDDLTNEPAQVVLNALEMNVTGAEAMNGAQVVVLLVGEDLVDVEMNIRRPSVPAMFVTNVNEGRIAFSMPGVVDPGTFYDVEIHIGDEALVCVLEEQRGPTTPGDAPLRIEDTLDALACEPGTPPDCGALDDACDMGDVGACEDLARTCPFVDCGR